MVDARTLLDRLHTTRCCVEMGYLKRDGEGYYFSLPHEEFSAVRAEFIGKPYIGGSTSLFGMRIELAPEPFVDPGVA